MVNAQISDFHNFKKWELREIETGRKSKKNSTKKNINPTKVSLENE